METRLFVFLKPTIAVIFASLIINHLLVLETILNYGVIQNKIIVMNMKSLIFLAGILFAFILACTPKTTEQAKETTIEPVAPPPSPANIPCPRFSDSPNPDETTDNFVLYKDFIRAKDLPQAFSYWEKVYAVAPAADGNRNSVYSDGIWFCEQFIEASKDSLEKEKYIDKIFQLYDEMEECYPDGGYITGRKAFDYFYKYRHRKSFDEIYAMFKKSIEQDNNEARYFVLNPFTALLVEQHYDEKISTEEAQKYQQLILKVLNKNLASCKGQECEKWKIIEEYVPARLESFEAVKGFYPCEYFQEKYYADFEANPTDCEVIINVYSRFKYGGCPESGAKFEALKAAYNENCKEDTGPGCRDFLAEGSYKEAIDCYETKAAETDDKEKKAQYLIVIAKIYHAHLKNFSMARKYALKAADVKPKWGEPYLLIGRLYASSGPLCGPGRGWDSQIVTWPAIDMWNKAKSIDPNARAEANKWINQYSQYMPDVEDIFIRGLKKGDSFFVPCWIQRSTTVRPKS